MKNFFHFEQLKVLMIDRATRKVSVGLVALMLSLHPLSGNGACQAAVYQWSTPIEQIVTAGNKEHPRAFLWIPPDCQRVRAIVIGCQNMEEEQIFENREFRKTLTDLAFAEIWLVPDMGGTEFRFDLGDVPILTGLLGSLADKSGYREIASAPLVPIGHSARASWPWDVAAWNPRRVLAVLSVSGQWPYFSNKFWGDRSIDEVPGLTTKGEFEIQGSLECGWYASLKGDSFKKHPDEPFTQVVEPGGGHFNASKEKIELIDLYLRKAAKYRLPAIMPTDGPVSLIPINAHFKGWLYDVWHRTAPPSASAAPVSAYEGKKEAAFWAFDEEMATAIEKFQGRFRDQKNVLIGYQQKDGLTPPTPDHAMVHLKFQPIGDGMTFKLAGGFWDKVPPTKDGKDSEWQGWLSEGGPSIAQNDLIPHPTGEAEKMSIATICGPVLQTAPDTFEIRENQVGVTNPHLSNDIWLALTYAGDGEFKGMVQQAELQFPLINKRGKPQQIDFPKISDQSAGGSMVPIKLQATSNAGIPVYYYVREGPAEVDDEGNLAFTPIPPRSKFPISVSVVAWQWGRSIDPFIQSATPVTQTFQITASK